MVAPSRLKNYPIPEVERTMTYNRSGRLAAVTALAERMGGWSALADAIVASIPHRPLPHQLAIKVRATDMPGG